MMRFFIREGTALRGMATLLGVVILSFACEASAQTPVDTSIAAQPQSVGTTFSQLTPQPVTHQVSKPLDRIEMRAIGRDEMQLDPALGPGEPFLH